VNWKPAIVVFAASACLAVASFAGAAHAGQFCSPFKQGHRTYHWETLGTGWTCGSAKRWIAKLIPDRVHVTSKNVPLKNGPRGYHCNATPGSSGGHATNGECFTGTLAHPKSGFAWTSY
jgi:hypothetical protein